jgi:photolyase PhrII
MYWMRVAARATQNPALDVALTAARELKLPIFVYHAVSQRYRYASDRLHTFLLEGAVDVQAALTARGIGYVMPPPQSLTSGNDVLKQLVQKAALVVTDFMPVQPLLRWDAAVATQVPLWRVDASCLAPLWQVPGRHDRAFAFRKKAEPLWQQALAHPWVDVEPTGPAFLPELPFVPVDWRQTQVRDVVAGCDVDHTVAPVFDTPGGTTAATERWQQFAAGKLGAYAKNRNDPNRMGESRLSPYLHLGHISPFRVAQDCAAHRTDGASKYLDELLTWRELAWHLCLHQPMHESVEALPAWARQTLRAHEGDPRIELPSYEQLARAQTSDPLWNAAQRSLLTQGHLHNNVRMTWGKAFLGWTRNVSDALALAIDLNHRFALDGRDPASYGGILWCFGALDRPFAPELPITGTVRPRPTKEHARRLDVAEYERQVHRPSGGKPWVIAVVGAGPAGCAAARTMVDAGHTVVLFDKGRGPGGRASTRHAGELRFDHGAPFFTVTDERFARWVRAWWHERVVAEWKPRVESLGPGPHQAFESSVRLVGTPSMSTVIERMQQGLDVRFGTAVTALRREGALWRVHGENHDSLGSFDAVVVAVPAPQAATLLDPVALSLASRLREIQYAPCIATMVSFDEQLDLSFDVASVNASPLAWAFRESSKPKRAAGERWVLHATQAWSQAHLDASVESLAPVMLEAFFAASGAKPTSPAHLTAHRWRFSVATHSLGEACLFDASLRIAACGDGLLGHQLESAWLSGQAAGGRINSIPRPIVAPPAPLQHPSQMRLLE